MRILCGQAITPDEVLSNTVISIEGGKISSIAPSDGSPVDIDASGKTAVPGFIDIHVHGGVGCEVMDGTVSAIRRVSAHLASNGVTSWLPSIHSGTWYSVREAVESVYQAMHDGSSGAEVLGAHLEGPYINPTRKGAQPSQYMRAPQLGELYRELRDLAGFVKYMAVAPELPGGLDLIRDLRSKGIVVSLAHTDASYEEACAAYDAGATGLTHAYNAMRPLHHREPGVLAAAMLDNRVTAELTWDNFHVHEAAARMVVRLKGPERVALISDAISAAGLPDGEHYLGGQPIRVTNGQARLIGGAIAGSTITLHQAVRNVVEYFSLQDAIKMATVSPARAVGVDDRKGRIAPGYDADIVLLTPDLSVDSVFLRGQLHGRSHMFALSLHKDFSSS